jgi:hypothetical protein
VLNIEARGRGKVIAALTSEQVTAQLVGKTLKAEQQKSVVDICTTTDRFGGSRLRRNREKLYDHEREGRSGVAGL